MRLPCLGKRTKAGHVHLTSAMLAMLPVWPVVAPSAPTARPMPLFRCVRPWRRGYAGTSLGDHCAFHQLAALALLCLDHHYLVPADAGRPGLMLDTAVRLVWPLLRVALSLRKPALCLPLCKPRL